MTTQHTHPMIFGRREPGCPRCVELNAGAPVVRWAITDRKADEAARLRAIRAHDCKASRCGVVCTAFDW